MFFTFADRMDRAVLSGVNKATIRLGDFERVVQPVSEEFFYCVPPYDDCFNGWSEAGAQVMLSNSYTPLVHCLIEEGEVLLT